MVLAAVVYETDAVVIDIVLRELAVGGDVLPACSHQPLHRAVGRLHGERVDGFRGG